MSGRVHIIVSCTDRKRRPIDKTRRLRTVRARSLEERFERWWGGLGGPASESFPAEDVYAGDHWTIARELPDVAATHGLQASLWVASAGYGLVRSDTMIKGYSATFRHDEDDSVATSASTAEADNRAWWACFSATTTSPCHQRSLASLARSDSNATMIFVGSPVYVSAVEDDLRNAKRALGTHADLLILSSDQKPTNDLVDNLVVCSQALQPLVGGAMTSLHVRVAKALLSHQPFDLTASAANEYLTKSARDLPAVKRPERKVQDDVKIAAYIKRACDRDETMSASRLLRQYRDQGFACEQGRFKNLFRKVAATT